MTAAWCAFAMHFNSGQLQTQVLNHNFVGFYQRFALLTLPFQVMLASQELSEKDINWALRPCAHGSLRKPPLTLTILIAWCFLVKLVLPNRDRPRRCYMLTPIFDSNQLSRMANQLFVGYSAPLARHSSQVRLTTYI